MLDKPDSIAEFFNIKIKLLPYSLFTEKRDFQIIDMMECRRFQIFFDIWTLFYINECCQIDEMSQMEEGELLEEGEITDDDILFPNPEVNQSGNSSDSSDSVICITNKSEFDASLKRKRDELVAKLTGHSQDELGEVVEPSKDALDWYAGKAYNGSKSSAAVEYTRTIKKTKEVPSSTVKSFQSGNNFYMDLDCNENSADMLNNWAKAKGAKNAETSSKLADDATMLANCDSPFFDPNDEYYGETTVTSTSSLEQISGSTTIKSEERGPQQPLAAERGPRSRSNRKRVDERSRAKKLRHGKGGPGGCRSPRPKRKRTSMSPTRSENDSRSGEERPKQEQNAGGLVRTGRAKRRSSKSPPPPAPPPQVPLPQAAAAAAGTARERGDRRDRTLCRFFKEGFCREGDRCPYSHVSPATTAKRSPSAAATSQNKRKELCKYFASGYCRNGRKCPYMHNDLPCKFFPIGDCRKGERCRYSHAINADRGVNSEFAKSVPLEEQHVPPLGSKIASVQLELPTRRKVLLNDPPKQAMLPTPYTGTGLLPSPPREMAAGNCDQPSSYAMSHDDGISFPYANMEREYSRISQEPLLETPNIKSENFMAEAQTGSLIDDVEMRKEKEHDETGTSKAAAVPTAKINIIAMLREIKSQVKGADKIQDSPASPEPMKQWVLVPQTVLLVDFKLQLLGDVKRENKVRDPTMVISLKDVKLRADPRVKKYLANQFDAVSDLFTGSKPLDNPTPAIVAASPSANNVRESVDATSAQDVTDPTSSTKSGRSSPSSAVVLGTVDARPRDPRIKTQPGGPGAGSGSVPPEMPMSNAILPYDSASNVRMACFPDPIRNYGYGHGGQPMPMEPEMVNPMAYPDMPPRYNGSNDMFDPYMAAPPPAQLNGPAFCPRPDMMGPRHAYAHNGPYGGGPMPSGGGYAGGVSRYRPHGLLYVGDGPVRQRPPQSRMNVMVQPPRPHAKGRIIDPINKNGPSDPRLKRFAAAAPPSTTPTVSTTTTPTTTTAAATAAADVIADADAAAVSNSSCGVAVVNQDPSLNDGRGSVPASADSLETISNQEKIPSLRERRKDLQYESPLNAGPTV
ncbi:Zinc finger CCCH domain-containing protein 6 [Trichinella spiralis]|uniref:Zinc finger CCCH domain-containing protein 6 n=1 Tax=Trichinella spiralis TaxID=6334 RepID=A0A0V1C229_TRISP|nr:Zinc finger CCCH domain-containing protein 6 [Trichinella spiralis]